MSEDKEADANDLALEVETDETKQRIRRDLELWIIHSLGVLFSPCNPVRG